MYPRDICKEALLKGAVALILVHNHPGGSLYPSLADEHLTKMIMKSAQLFDIRVLGSFYRDKNDWYSFQRMAS